MLIVGRFLTLASVLLLPVEAAALRGASAGAGVLHLPLDEGLVDRAELLNLRL